MAREVEVRARDLNEGETYYTFDADEDVTISVLNFHGDTVLVTDTDGNDSTLDGDEVVVRVDWGSDMTETRDTLIGRARSHVETWSKTNSASPSHVALVRELADQLEASADQAEPQLVSLVREIHEAVVNAPPGRLVFEVEPDPTDRLREVLKDDLRPGDIVIEKGAGLTLLNGTLGTDITEPLELGDHPETPYAVRIFYADGTMEEVFNIDGVQVANTANGDFPFGFVDASDGDDEDNIIHKPGYWDHEGNFVPFADARPTPGW